jgi:hypothetical protein
MWNWITSSLNTTSSSSGNNTTNNNNNRNTTRHSSSSSPPQQQLHIQPNTTTPSAIATITTTTTTTSSSPPQNLTNTNNPSTSSTNNTQPPNPQPQNQNQQPSQQQQPTSSSSPFPLPPYQAIVHCLSSRGWDATTSEDLVQISWIENVEREQGGGVLRTNSFIVEGNVPVDSLGKSGSGRLAPPDVMEEALLEVAHQHNVEIDIRLDVLTNANDIQNPHVFELFPPEHPSRKLTLKHHPLRILCWTSWDKNSRTAIERVIKMSRTHPTRIPTTLCFDPDPNRACESLSRDQRKWITTTNVQHKWLWAGPDGWESEAARFLSLQDSGPTAFIFDDEGNIVESGDPDELEIYDPDFFVGDDDEDDHDDEHDHDEQDAITKITDPRMDNLTPSQAETFLEEIITKLKPVVNKIVSEKLNGIPFTVLMRTKTEITPAITTTSSTTTPTTTSNYNLTIHRQFYVAGDVFPIAEEEFEQFGKWLDDHATGVGWLGVRHVTPAKKITPALACTLCGKPTIPKVGEIRYVCFICRPLHASHTEDVTLCPTCAHTHDIHHPLAVLFPFSAREGIMYGRNHVVSTATTTTNNSSNPHPNVLCDACASPIEKLRYKNLCVLDHDLCHNCFKMFREFSAVATHPKFDTFFHCKSNHIFVEMKSSRGLRFDREHVMETTATGGDVTPTTTILTIPTIVTTTTSTIESTSIGNSSTTLQNKIPRGHTAYSWIPSKGQPIPRSHSIYSWRGGLDQDTFL